MFWYDFSFRSLTAAQDGRSVLEHAGIGAELLRAPQAISEQGCGYVVETAILKERGRLNSFWQTACASGGCSDGMKTEWWRKRAMIYFDAAATTLQKPPQVQKNGGLRDGALREPWKRGISRGHAGLRRGL